MSSNRASFHNNPAISPVITWASGLTGVAMEEIGKPRTENPLSGSLKVLPEARAYVADSL